MRFLLTILIAIIFSYQAQACTIIPNSFCQSINTNEEFLIVSGVIASKDEDGLDLELIEIFRGTENNSQIRIWDGTDFDCNGPWDMSTNPIGAVGDTIIISLPKIEEIENTWDVIGDYRRPDPYNYTSELSIKNGTAEGFISGDAIAPPQYNTYSLPFETLRASLLEFEDCSNIILNTNELFKENLSISPNPVNSTLNIQSNSSLLKEIVIYNELGIKVFEQQVNQKSNKSILIKYLSQSIKR